MMKKPTVVKPAMYSLFYLNLREIAYEYGYNLLVNGSMSRDLDLVAVPWGAVVKDEQDMIFEFSKYLGGRLEMAGDTIVYHRLPQNRNGYMIYLNESNKEWYIDVSVVQSSSN